MRYGSKGYCDKQKHTHRRHNLECSNKGDQGDECKSFSGINCCKVGNRMSFILAKAFRNKMYGTVMLID